MTVVAGDWITIAAHGQAITGLLRLFPLAHSSPGQVTDCDNEVVLIGCSDCAADLTPYGALIGRIDGGIPFLIGRGGTVRRRQVGPLQLAANDNQGCYDDNHGGFIVLIEID